MVSNSTKILDQNCWPDWPQWECYATNCAGLVSTALWFIVLLPQVLKHFYRQSVVGLSFLWAVANFTASLVNLFFAFSVELPLYVRVSAVYQPVLEFTILLQFLTSHKPVTTRLLTLLVCLLVWGDNCRIGIEPTQISRQDPMDSYCSLVNRNVSTDHFEYLASIN